MKTHNKRKISHKLRTRTRKKRITGGNNTKSSGGIFCYMPYNSLDTHNKSTFKIESTTNIREELKNLKKFFPTGFYVISILTAPTVGNKTIKNRKMYYQLIKDNVVEFAVNGGGISVNSNDGWVHCTIENIHNAFEKAEKKYGGERQEFGLTGKVNDNMELVDVKNTKKPIYVGKIIFHT
jgi:hypothetical protein